MADVIERLLGGVRQDNPRKCDCRPSARHGWLHKVS